MSERRWRGLHTAGEKPKDVRSTVNGTIGWLDWWPDYFVPEWNMSAKYSINWHEIGFVRTTIQLIGVTLGQGRWIQMHEAAGRKCSGWGVMRITAIPGTGKHEGTSGREDGRSPKLSKPSGNGKQNRGLNNAWTKEGGEKQVREINGNTRNKGEFWLKHWTVAENQSRKKSSEEGLIFRVTLQSAHKRPIKSD